MFLKLLENIFGHFVERRNNSFNSNRIKRYKAKIPVISIGNISVGGSGKTPFTIELAKLLLENGIKPSVIGSGYKGKSSGGFIVSDGKQIFADASQAGDEMILIAHKVNVPVVIHQKKYEAAKIVENHFKVDVILIDDGFQHRFLQRDLDIVLIDSKTLEQPFLLPRGRLREPLKSLKRADIICLYSQNDYIKIADYIRKDAEVFYISTKNDGVYNFNDYCSFFSRFCNSEQIEKSYSPEEKNLMNCYPITQKDEEKNIFFKTNENFASISSIAQPERFFNSIKDFNLIHNFIFRDHHQYSEKNVNSIIRNCKKKGISNILTTEKDAVKLHRYKELFDKHLIFVYVFSIKIDIFNFQKLTDIVLKTFH